MAKGKVDLTLADRVYEMAAAHIIPYNISLSMDKVDTLCRRSTEHRGASSVSWYSQLRLDMMRAEKIVLDDEFVRLVARQSLDETQHINIARTTRHLSLSRNPFNITWLEWDARVMFDERIKLGTMKEIAEDAPKRLGVIIRATNEDGSDYNVQEFVADPSGEVGYSTCKLFVNTEGPVSIPPQRRTPTGTPLAYNDEQYRTVYLLGGQGSVWGGENTINLWKYAKGVPVLDQIALDITDPQYNILFYVESLNPKGGKLLQTLFDGQTKESAGAGRFLFTALALMNEANIQYHYLSQPSGRRLASGKTIPYMSHRTVTIKVPGGVRNIPKYFDKILSNAARNRHRAHQVRGFWRTLYKGTKAEKQVWVKTHTRGDASLGWVNQTHIATT